MKKKRSIQLSSLPNQTKFKRRWGGAQPKMTIWERLGRGSDCPMRKISLRLSVCPHFFITERTQGLLPTSGSRCTVIKRPDFHLLTKQIQTSITWVINRSILIKFLLRLSKNHLKKSLEKCLKISSSITRAKNWIIKIGERYFVANQTLIN